MLGICSSIESEWKRKEPKCIRLKKGKRICLAECYLKGVNRTSDKLEIISYAYGKVDVSGM